MGWGNVLFTCAQRIDYIMISSLALAHTHRHHSTCSYVVRSSLALAHGQDATLWYFLLQVHNLAHTLDAMSWCLFWDRIHQWIARQILAKWQLTDNMKKGWKTCRLNYLSSNYPNTSFVQHFLQIEVRNAGVRGTVVLCFSHLIVLVGVP